MMEAASNHRGTKNFSQTAAKLSSIRPCSSKPQKTSTLVNHQMQTSGSHGEPQ
jgi:hypothetical protein